MYLTSANSTTQDSTSKFQRSSSRGLTRCPLENHPLALIVLLSLNNHLKPSSPSSLGLVSSLERSMRLGTRTTISIRVTDRPTRSPSWPWNSIISQGRRWQTSPTTQCLRRSESLPNCQRYRNPRKLPDVPSTKRAS